MRESQVGRFAATLADSYDMRKDYLRFKDRQGIQDDMVKQQEPDMTDECFSDSVFVQGKSKSIGKRRCAILITQNKAFLYDISTSRWKLVFKATVDSITKVTIASESCAFLAINFDKDMLVLESFRRVELIAYLAAVRKRRGLPPFQVMVSKTIELKTTESSKTSETKLSASEAKDAKESKDVKSPQQPPKLVEVPMLAEAIRNSRKSGFMRKLQKGGFFGGAKHHEYFFLLSDIGLVYFRKYGDDKSVGFMPLLGGSVQACNSKQFPGKDYVMCIKHHDHEKFLQCYSQLEMED